MRKSLKQTGMLFLALTFIFTPALALAQAQTGKTAAQSYYDGVFGKPAEFKADKYAAGQDETRYYAATDWDYVAMQLKYKGITDAVLEEFIANITAPPYDLGNPAGWMIAAHYPTGTGNADVDKALAARAQTLFEQSLPDYNSIVTQLNPANWPPKDQINNNDNPFDGEKLQMYLSFLSKKLQLIQDKEYAYPVKDGGPVLPFITNYQIMRPQARYLSVVFTSWMFSGGAHDFWQAHALSFDLKTGKELKIGDLLPGKTAVDKLQAHLMELDKAQRGDSDYMATFNKNIYPDLDMHRIAMTPEGLTIIFDPYEIGSFAEGTIVFNITKDELKAMGANMQYWQ